MMNMKINIRNIDINYIQYGSGKDIVLLHGWGQNIEMMRPIGDRFSKRFKITILFLYITLIIFFLNLLFLIICKL